MIVHIPKGTPIVIWSKIDNLGVVRDHTHCNMTHLVAPTTPQRPSLDLRWADDVFVNYVSKQHVIRLPQCWLNLQRLRLL